jgi:hypothetical protein
MNEDTKKKVISITSTLIASQLASKLADKLFVEPEVRGVRDSLHNNPAVYREALGLLAPRGSGSPGEAPEGG